MFAGIALPGFCLSLIASVLLLLNTVSTPIAKDLYFLQVTSSSNVSSTSTSTLRLGTLGYCLSGSPSSLSSVTNGTATSGCTAVKLGYSLDYSLFTDGEVWGINVGNLSDSVIKGLTYLLVLQPIAASVALITLVFAFFAWFCSSRIMEIIAFMCTSVASLMAWIAWVLAMALFAAAKHRIEDASNGELSAKLGNCLWMGLGAALTLSIAICTTCVGTFGRYSSKKRGTARSGNRGTEPYQPAYQQMTHDGAPQQVTTANPHPRA